jgi:hypothetical protein
LGLRTNSGLKLVALLAGVVALFAGIDRYQHRFVRSGQDLIRLLPGGDTTLFYAQADVLRRAGMLNLIAGSKTPQEPEYQAFVRATGFDYLKDVDAIAGSARTDGLFLAVRGRFDWERIRAYIREQRGSCAADTCELPGNTPRAWISTVRIQPDVLGLALGKDKSLNAAIHPGRAAMALSLLAEPVWIRLAPSLLKNPAALPVGFRIFAIAMESANSVTLAAAPAPPDGADAFEIKLLAQCPSAATADTIRQQLQIETKMLKLELTHEHAQPNPADLTGLLTSGTFQTNGSDVTGGWPVRKELLKALQQ